MKTQKMVISGTVQGVLFRRFVKESADKLGVKGFVRNLDDGNLEIVSEGRDEKVDEFFKLCKIGPKHADVKNIRIENLNHQSFEEFKIIHM